jgi:hypothetical protein
MSTLLNRLQKNTFQALRLTSQFLAVGLLGMLAALLYALPWLLRLTSLLLWLAGGYQALQAVQAIYGGYSPSGAVLALQFVVILLMVAWAGSLLRVAPPFFWGGLAFGGIVTTWTGGQGLPWLLSHWQEADDFFRLLPPALFSLGLIHLTLRLRSMRQRPPKENSLE